MYHIWGLVGIDPLPKIRHLGINSRGVWATSHSPCHQTHNCPPSSVGLTHKRWPTITCASILSNFTTSTNLTGMELESVSSSLSLLIESKLEVGVTSAGRYQRKGNLFLDELEWSINFILAPASNPASNPSTIVENIVKLVVTRWQTGCVDIGVAQVNVSVSIEEGNVIAESSSRKLWVLENPDNCVLLMVESFRRVEATSIPFSNSNFQ